MSIRLAFSTVACPQWTLTMVLERARAIGYQGIELRTLGPGASGLASDPALSDPARVAAHFREAGVEPVCLSTSTALHHRDTTVAQRAALQVRRDLDLAAAIGCRFVRIYGERIEPGQDGRTVLGRIAAAARPLAEEAAARGVQILFENAGSFNHATQWWWLLDLVRHPAVGLCWNVAHAAAAGESPAVSVPTLHSRIRLAKVKDATPGEGDAGVEEFLKRLLGIGYDGYVSVEWDRLCLPHLAAAEEHLPDAHRRLKAWLDSIEELEERGRKAAAKAASKSAPRAAPPRKNGV